MKYKGKLYGTIDSRKFFPLEMTSEDIESIVSERNQFQEALKQIFIDEGQHVPLREGSTAYRMRAIARKALKGDDDGE